MGPANVEIDIFMEMEIRVSNLEKSVIIFELIFCGQAVQTLKPL